MRYSRLFMILILLGLGSSICLSGADQKKYMESLLVDFSNYLQEQRKQDLMIVQSKVNSIEKNSNQFKQETEQILASLISSPSPKKNY